jgi:hypothetical protein
MTDRELLELAAKAAGLEIHTARQAERDEEGCANSGLWIINGSTCWNPLTDDGDALRLAVRLNLNVHVDCEALPPWILVENNTSQDPKYISAEEKGGALGADLNIRLAATRRAIVGAAAEIGGTME